MYIFTEAENNSSLKSKTGYKNIEVKNKELNFPNFGIVKFDEIAESLYTEDEERGTTLWRKKKL